MDDLLLLVSADKLVEHAEELFEIPLHRVQELVLLRLEPMACVHPIQEQQECLIDHVSNENVEHYLTHLRLDVRQVLHQRVADQLHLVAAVPHLAEDLAVWYLHVVKDDRQQTPQTALHHIGETVQRRVHVPRDLLRVRLRY